MNTLNLQNKDYLMIACVIFVGVFLYMEMQKNRCQCNEKFITTVKPTFHRSLVSLPSVDGPCYDDACNAGK